MRHLPANLRNLPGSGKAGQRGVVLFVVLIFLLMLTYVGLAAMQGATLEERMAGNLRDRNVALEAAELALRDAERDIRARLADGATLCPAGGSGTINGNSVTCRGAKQRGTTVAEQDDFFRWGPDIFLTWTPGCTGGQCMSIAEGALTPVWADNKADWSPQPGSTGSNPTIEYGTFTGATDVPKVSQQPRYILEIFPADPSVYGTGGTEKVAFRITARAVGQNPNTVVMLQAVSSQ